MTPTFANPDSRFGALRCAVAGAIRGKIGAQVNGPERGVGTSGRGLADASKGVD